MDTGLGTAAQCRSGAKGRPGFAAEGISLMPPVDRAAEFATIAGVTDETQKFKIRQSVNHMGKNRK